MLICLICQLADIVISLVSLLMNTDVDLLTSAHHEDRVATRSVCASLLQSVVLFC